MMHSCHFAVIFFSFGFICANKFYYESIQLQPCGLQEIGPIFLNWSFGAVHNANPHSWPWTVAFCWNDEKNPNKCQSDAETNLDLQAVIIGKKWLFGLFLPMMSSFTNRLLAVSGSHNWMNLNGSTLQFARVRKVHFLEPLMHNFWSIALFELETPLEFNEWISPICLPKSDPDCQIPIRQSGVAIVANRSSICGKMPFYGKAGWVVGWDWEFGSALQQKQQSAEQFYLRQMRIRPIYGRTRHRNEHHEFIWARTQEREHEIHMGSQFLRQDAWGRWHIAGLLLADIDVRIVGRIRSHAKFYLMPVFCQWIVETTKNAIQCSPFPTGMKHDNN